VRNWLLEGGERESLLPAAAAAETKKQSHAVDFFFASSWYFRSSFVTMPTPVNPQVAAAVSFQTCGSNFIISFATRILL
jgi:hypothetical protein